jgi:hypothetical protein
MPVSPFGQRAGKGGPAGVSYSILRPGRKFNPKSVLSKKSWFRKICGVQDFLLVFCLLFRLKIGGTSFTEEEAA